MDQPTWPTALVTGASSGIGKQFAAVLAARGSDLVLVARRQERLEELAREYEEGHDVTVEVLPADLTDPAELGTVEQRLADGPTPVDLLVNNAGFGTYGPFAKQDRDVESAEVDLNATAVLRLTHAAIAGMLDRGRGAVLNMSSFAGFQPLPYNATYSATKAFVRVFSEALHEELRDRGVTVMALCPGFVRTEFQDAADVDASMVPEFAWLDRQDLVTTALADLEQGKAVSVPGVGYKLLGMMSRMTPRWAVRRIASSVGELA